MRRQFNITCLAALVQITPAVRHAWLIYVIFVLLAQTGWSQTPVFINEIHYDNAGADVGEAVEIAGPAGTDLTGWSIAFYNGSATQLKVYATVNLSGMVPDLCGGFGALAFLQAGIQNGAPDGLALVDNSTNVVQFLSYEGSFTAADGPAAGMTSTDIGVAETSSTPAGNSLQLGGTGTVYEDFSWNSDAANTFNACNTGQIFTAGSDSPPFVTGTTPANSSSNNAVATNVDVSFSEDVTVTGNWFDITGSTSAGHTATVSGGPQNYTLDPDIDFDQGEIVSVTLFAAQVSDNDTDDPPDNMAADFVFSFTTTSELSGWVINEILADPAADLTGDANGDGTRDGSQDEFVEIINISGAPLDISGWTIADAVAVRHTFPAGTIVPDQCPVLVFGGGTPTGSFGGALVQTASGGSLGLNNSGDTITLYDGSSDVTSLTYGSEGGDNQSLTRDPDISGILPLVKHTLATGSAGALFSPGTQIKGGNFPGCTALSSMAEIFEIQGSGLSSPFAGQTVTTENNIVTAVGADGFFIQTPTARSDGDPATSDGIFVFTGATPGVSVGDNVNVTGNIQEFFDFTELNNTTPVSVNSSGNALPAPVQFDDATPSSNQPQPDTELERFEGMLLHIAAGVVSSANQTFGSDPIAEVHIVAGLNRPFREPGIEFPGLSGLPLWDGNPEVFELDVDKLGLPNMLLNAGSTFDAVGVLGFEFGGYELWPTQLNVNDASLPVAVRERADGEALVGTLNLFRLFDDVDDPGSEDNGQVASPTEFQDRLTKFSMFIRNVMRSPEILAVQEVENIHTLQSLADKIAADDASVAYTPYLIEGNDIGGIDVGFLARDNVRVDSVVQKGKAEIFSFDGSLLHDRPPLCLFGKLPDGRELTILTVHMRSLGGITGSNGTRVRLKRQTQATSVSLMVNDLQTAHPDINLVVTGDFNAFQFTDGYAHVLGQIIGVPATASEAQLPGTDEVDPDLTNEILALAAAEQYSFIFDGNAQVLDHMLTSQALHPGVTGVQYARGNADAPRILVDDPSTALRASDHDGLVLYIASVAKENINALIEPKTRFVLFNFVTNQFSFQLAIANNSNQPIYAPICVKISDINPPPPTITIDNADNQQTGVGAVFNYSGLLGGDGKLDPGERSGFKTWRFNDPSQVNFSFFANVFGVLSNNTSGPSRLAGIANPAAQPLVFAADIRSGKLTMFSSLSEFEATQVPEEFALLQNYPNPFNPETIITYHLAADAKVRLTIYNLAGQEVTRLVDDEKEAGKYDVIWNGTDKAGKQVASGVYVYRIAAGNFKAVRKLTLLR